MKPYARGALGIGGLFLVGVLASPARPANLPATMAKPGGFPERPITLVVPYGPAGGSAQVSRAMAQAVQELTGVVVNLEYKEGGAGKVGLTNFMAVPADGYAVLQHIDDVVSAYAIGDSSVNPATDLVPLVTSQITFSQIYIRGNDTRFTDWNSFVAYAKQQSGKATIANVSAEGSMERVNMKLIEDALGFKTQQISFDQPAPRYGALKGGQVDALFEQPGDVKGFLQSGDFKPILTLLHERPGAFKEVPSLADAGLTFKPLMRFRGFYAHKGTPPDRLKWLQWAFQKAFDQPSYQKFNQGQFMDLIDSFRDTEGSRRLIGETVEGYKATYKAMGLIK